MSTVCPSEMSKLTIFFYSFVCSSYVTQTECLIIYLISKTASIFYKSHIMRRIRCTCLLSFHTHWIPLESSGIHCGIIISTIVFQCRVLFLNNLSFPLPFSVFSFSFRAEYCNSQKKSWFFFLAISKSYMHALLFLSEA